MERAHRAVAIVALGIDNVKFLLPIESDHKNLSLRTGAVLERRSYPSGGIRR
jgi:hypothetical protein